MSIPSDKLKLMIQPYSTSKKEHQPIFSAPNNVSKNKQSVQFKDNRPDATTQLKVQQIANQPIQRQENKTGMPDNLKSGIENLSGIDMSDVKVHYNSSQPAQLQAHAFAQGNQIHIASGQERHLPHEAWHVVQQKQGRVAPTKQLKGKVNINDDSGLEKEADMMGTKALQMKNIKSAKYTSSLSTKNIIQRYVIRGAYHVANDFSIAVGSADQNKELYATHAHIGNANQVLREKKGSIELEEGPAVNLHLQNVPALRRATPRVHNADRADNLRTGVPANLTVRRGVGDRVEMPSECEKGAVSIIGGFIENEKVAGNNFAYAASSHENARIANIIAQSPALPLQKQQWYQQWNNLNTFSNTATAAYNSFNRNNLVATSLAFTALQTHIGLTNNPLAQAQFNTNFQLNAGNYTTRTTRLQSAAVLEGFVRHIDNETNELEHLIQATSGGAHQLHQVNLLNQRNIRDALVALYAQNRFPQATIIQALNLTGQQAQSAKYFSNSLTHPGHYENNLNYLANYRMQNFLESLVQTLNNNIIGLERQRNASFGTAPTQNEAVNPEIGQSYGMIGGGYNFTDQGRWNWHWASVIMKSAQDNVTMEAHASKKQGNETHNYRWDIKMYGQPGYVANRGLTFHDRWKGDGFGSTPVTVLGKPYTQQAHSDNFDDYHITGLTGPQTITVLDEVNTLYGILGNFINRTQGALQLLTLDNLHRAEITRITQLAILTPFVHAKLDIDLTPFNTAIQTLRTGGLDDVARMNEETDVHDGAEDMRTELSVFYRHAKNYQTLQKKKAVAGF